MGQCKETTRGIRLCTLGLRKNKRTNISMSDNDQHKQKEQFTFMIFTTKCGGLFIAIVHLSRHPDPWIYSKFNVFSFSMASVVPFPRAHCSLPPRMFSIFSNRSFPLSPLATGLPFSFTALNSHPLFYLPLALCLFLCFSFSLLPTTIPSSPFLNVCTQSPGNVHGEPRSRSRCPWWSFSRLPDLWFPIQPWWRHGYHILSQCPHQHDGKETGWTRHVTATVITS